MNPIFEPKFPLGRIVATPGTLAALEQANQTPMQFLVRHALGDWGEVCDEDKKLNEQAMVEGDRMLSCYSTSQGEKLWVITEADRSATMLLLPEEY